MLAHGQRTLNGHLPSRMSAVWRWRVESCLNRTIQLPVRSRPMTRFTSKALLLVLTWGFFAPLATALAPASPHACCLRKAAHCCEHAKMQMGPMDIAHMDMGATSDASADAPATSFRGADCCNQDSGCCRGLSSSIFALTSALPSGRTAALTVGVAPRQDSPRSQFFTASQEVRGPPSL